MPKVLNEPCYCGADAGSNLAAAKVFLGFLARLLPAFPKSVRSAKEFLPERKLGKSCKILKVCLLLLEMKCMLVFDMCLLHQSF